MFGHDSVIQVFNINYIFGHREGEKNKTLSHLNHMVSCSITLSFVINLSYFLYLFCCFNHKVYSFIISITVEDELYKHLACLP